MEYTCCLSECRNLWWDFGLDCKTCCCLEEWEGQECLNVETETPWSLEALLSNGNCLPGFVNIKMYSSSDVLDIMTAEKYMPLALEGMGVLYCRVCKQESSDKQLLLIGSINNFSGLNCTNLTNHLRNFSGKLQRLISGMCGMLVTGAASRTQPLSHVTDVYPAILAIFVIPMSQYFCFRTT